VIDHGPKASGEASAWPLPERARTISSNAVCVA
jgi:hypothetical protein